MSSGTGAGVLVAEAVGLLLEGWALDDTLSGADSLALVCDLAALPHDAVLSEHVEAALADLLERAHLRAMVRDATAEVARARGLPSDAPHQEAAMCVLTAGLSAKYIGGLKGVPDDFAALTLHEFETDHREIAKMTDLVEKRWRVIEPNIESTALTALNPKREVRALRDRGWLFGAIRTTSDGARDRVRAHLSVEHRGKGAETMARLLDRVIEYQDERAKLDKHVAASSPWVRWAVDSETGKLNRLRVASLRWMLAHVEAGEFGPIEVELLSSSAWRTALSQEPVRRAVRALTRQAQAACPALASVSAAALHRLGSWLDEPAVASRPDFAELLSTVQSQAPLFAATLAVLQASEDAPELRSTVDAAMAMSTGPFGAGDANRARFRTLLEGSRREVEDLRHLLKALRPQHPQVAAIVGDLRQAEGQMIADLRTQTPVRGPLRVAIAGRTKAGKTTLRKVLTRDVSEVGIGRGAHRTTRTADDFAWDRIIFVDTPGVSAKDDDYDAELAAQTCRDADAVVWVYAESLHEEEALILQSLLTVKPVLVVYNAKWKVEDPRRLALFARQPGLAFRDETSHAERSQQMADAVEVRAPLFIAAHVSAARRALIAGPEADAAWLASRIPLLESELRRVLCSQAQGLRALRLADQVRTPIVVTAGRAASVAASHAERAETFRHRIDNEERDLQEAIGRAINRAQRLSQKHFATVQAQLPAWAAQVGGKSVETVHREWAKLLKQLQVDDVLQGISETLRNDAKLSGLLLDREDRLEERLQRRRPHQAARKGRSRLAMAWRFIKKFVGLAFRIAPRLAGEAVLGPAGWLLIGAEVVTTLGKAATDEVRASNIDQHAWQQNASRAAREELERVRMRVAQELDVISAGLTASATRHCAQARIELAAIDDNLAALACYVDDADGVIATIDKLTVERLLALGEVAATVLRVDRVPNLHLRVEITGDLRASRKCLAAVFDGCLSEAVTVTQARSRARREHQLTGP